MLVQSMHYFILSSAVNLQDSCREKQWDGWIDNQLIFYLVTVAVDTTFRLTLTPCLFFFFQEFTSFQTELNGYTLVNKTW